MVRNNPTLVLAANRPSLFLGQATTELWTRVKRVLRFARAMIRHGITFKASNDKLVATGYCDSNLVAYKVVRKSTFGYVFLVARRAK